MESPIRDRRECVDKLEKELGELARMISDPAIRDVLQQEDSTYVEQRLLDALGSSSWIDEYLTQAEVAVWQAAEKGEAARATRSRPRPLDTHSGHLRAALEAVRDVGFELRDKRAWPAVHQLRLFLAGELRRRGEDSKETRLVLDHGDHEVWINDDTLLEGRDWLPRRRIVEVARPQGERPDHAGHRRKGGCPRADMLGG